MIRRTVTVATLSAMALAGCSSSGGSGGPSPSSGGAASTSGGSSSPSATSSVQPASLGSADAAQCSAKPAGDTPAAKGENTGILASTEGSGYGHPETDVRTENVDLGWDGTTLQGTATVTFAATRPTSTIGLDLAPQLTVKKVTLDGREVTATHPGHTLNVATGSLGAGRTGKLVITYAGRPHGVTAPSTREDNSAGLGWVKQSDGSVTTYAEPYGNSTWAPLNETPGDKAVFSASIHTKSPTVGIFNGALCSTTTTGSTTTTTWHAAEPMAAYLITLDLGPYRESDVKLGDRTAKIYAQPKDAAAVTTLRENLPASYEWLTKRVGPYPFQQLGVVVTQGSGGMETQGLISIDAKTIVKAQRSVILHELAHQWFGDLVTPSSWTDLWLNEGAAMFAELQGSDEGATDEDVLRACRASTQQAGQVSAERPGHFAEMGPYVCGALAFSELRDQIGDTAFWKTMGGWARSRPYESASREDFATYWQKTTGHDPRPTLAKWLDHVSPDTTTSTHVVAHPASSPDAPTPSGSASSPFASSSTSTP